MFRISDVSEFLSSMVLIILLRQQLCHRNILHAPVWKAWASHLLACKPKRNIYLFSLHMIASVDLFARHFLGSGVKE